ncbi:MAG TPA: hypothetical protein VFH27_17800 [Longimicrobiaceae bacterium]|nr:hypothetical protein [Longimicrobiaceae bacterium]
MNHPAAIRLRGAGVAIAALALLLFSPPRTAAQQALAGRVVLGDAPVPGAAITLHRVTRGASGPVATGRSGPDGTFRIAIPPAPPVPPVAQGGFTVYFATAEVDGVRYFGRPLHAGEATGDYRIVAFDTTSSALYLDSVRVARRDIALIPEAQGGWEVGEIIRVVNGSQRTLVPAEGPLVSLGLPEGATAFEVGEGELGKDEVLNIRGKMYLRAALPPGAREIFVRYRMLKGRTSATFPVTLVTDTLNVFVRQPAPEASVKGLRGPRPFEAQGEKYAQYVGNGLTPANRIVLTWSNPFASPVDPRIAALVLAGLVLLAGVVIAFRRGRGDRGARTNASAGGPEMRAGAEDERASAVGAGTRGG